MPVTLHRLQTCGAVISSRGRYCDFFRRTTYVHTCSLTQHVLRGVQLSCPAMPSNLSPVESVWGINEKRKLTLCPKPATTIAELRQNVQDTWDLLSQDALHMFITICMREYTPLMTPENTVVNATVWATLTVKCVSQFFWTNTRKLNWNVSTITFSIRGE